MPKTSPKQTITYLAAMFATALWASSFPATRFVLQYYSPSALMLIRFSTAAITLCIIGTIRKIKLPKLKDLPILIACGLSGIFFYSWFFNTGSVTVSAGVSSFIIAASPVFTLVLSQVFLKEKMNFICWLGVVVGLAGLAVVTLTQAEQFAWDMGVFLIIGASISSGVYTFISRLATKSYSALEVTTYAMVSGTVGMLAFLPDAIREIPESNVTVNLIVVFLGIFPAALAYLAWNYALSKAEKTAHVTVFSYLIPFISALLGYLWLRETLTVYALLGGIVIIAGMLLTNMFGKTKQEIPG